MKSRSHGRLPTSDPTPDDWVDGSWTVDCVCGVNFDDGEEMVNCDECGVWVHTRCSRYVKSEKSFACHKCKMSKNNNNRNSSSSNNDSKETEVAQLLVEFPITTLMMDKTPYPPPISSHPPRRRPRLWTDIPIQERVHVHGVPGGEPTLFGGGGGGGGLSSVFTPQLWKSTGYVPKKFNFQYREFPCWDEEKAEVAAKTEEENDSPENENPVDKGAGVLFSLSKKNVMAAPVAASVGMRRRVDGSSFNRPSSPSKHMKKWEGGSVDVRSPRNGVKKDRKLLRPFVVHSGKRKQEDSGASKDRSGKKKVRVVDRDGDPKKRAPQASKTASILSSDARQLESCEDRGPKIIKTDSQTIKNADLRGTMVKDPLLSAHHVVENNIDKPNDNLAARENPSETLASDVSGHNFPIGARSMEEKIGHQLSARSDRSYKVDDGTASSLEQNDAGSAPVKEEVGVFHDSANGNGGGSPVGPGFDPHKSDLPAQDAPSAVAEGEDGQNAQDRSVDMCPPRSLGPEADVKTEPDLDNSGGTFKVDSSTVNDVKPDGTNHSTQLSGASANLSANLKTSDTVVTSSQFGDLKVQNCERITETTNNCETDTADKFPSNPCQPDQPLEDMEVSTAVGKSPSELKQDSRSAEEQPKGSSTTGRRKSATPSSVSSTIMISKRSVLDNRSTSNAQNHNPIIKKGISVSVKKDNGSTDTGRGDERHEMPRKTWKDGVKSSISSVPKASPLNKIAHASDSRKIVSDSKDRLRFASSKASSTENIGVTSGSCETSNSLQSQSGSHVQNKVSASGLPQKGEKVNQSNSQPSTKLHHSMPVHPPGPSNSPALLSDEELALLLHQELNSSPRVPRVPRMRHTGSLPQLGSPTATSMLIKRTSSSGGRDNNVFARRKAKDLPKHESRSSREIDDEAKMDRLPPSRDPRRHDSACTADDITKRETDSGSGKGPHVVKKSAPAVSSATVSSGPSSSNEANEQNFLSMCNSPRNTSDDDTGSVRGRNHRTLPGLIAEIMSKGKRMTYEELCSAVLPHWPNLRKHNGERYAYSSHSQAVLDCLRNRHEWAQLVDRGPKTNASRKRRKLDADAPSFESEDNEYGKDTTGKEVESKSFESHREEFPKGKRKARKRRRLALKGRGIKDVRKQRKADALSYDDVDSFSSSSEASVFSDDETQGGGSEASASSDERGNVS
ncbi:hypothetical protein RHSIM_Rhsim07G0076500 [Rhododendron simsii]|uniref:Zinc finger PHD-type domain-containing protein n=1 Tax=Rhododendron simsii TaxID=118357 RepID=A0A834GMH0_RHOSS|nr:hypothetical protein RHSIM_Rhsim07G0076500 [Rhododendron simsii]